MVLKTTDAGAGAAGTLTVKLQRAILIDGARHEAGSVHTLPKALAMQLIGALQAVPEAPPAEPAPQRAPRASQKG